MQGTAVNASGLSANPQPGALQGQTLAPPRALCCSPERDARLPAAKAGPEGRGSCGAIP